MLHLLLLIGLVLPATEATSPKHVALASTLDPAPTFFWGANGHRVVGAIAERYLSEAARQGVAALIGDTSLARVSTWADEIRSDSAWWFTSPWHYVNHPPGETYADLPAVPPAADSVGNVVDAILYGRAILRDPSRPRLERARALKFLVHFVGDVHQPLHTGYADDRGGNEVRLLWFGDPTNLHAVWDGKLIEQAALSYTELAGFIDHPTPEQVAAWQQDDLLVWVRESRAMLGAVYAIEDQPEHRDREGRLNLRYAFIYQNMPAVERRLLQAGIRLAGLLNEVFAG